MSKPTLSVGIVHSVLCIAVAVLYATAAAPGFGAVYRVDHVAATTPDGTGASWSDTISLVDAFAQAVDGDEIWIKAGTYELGSAATLASAAAIAVRGGFTGGATDDARADGAVTILDGKSANTANPVMNFTAASGRVTLERVEFVKIKTRALAKTGGADIVVSGCRFLHCNTSNTDTGRVALNFEGTASARAVITNCVFEANRYAGSGHSNQRGYTTWFSTFASVEISDTLFATNGLSYKTSPHGAGRESMRGAAVYSLNAPLSVARCEFRGNIYITHNDNDCGGVIWLEGSASGHSFRNCLFAGNWNSIYQEAQVGPTAGVIYILLGNKTDTVSVENCTFAHNVAYPNNNYVAAGITVETGSLTCRNSIFHGNVARSSGKAAADIALRGANASADIDWCLFDSLDAANIQAGAGTLTLGANNITGNPLFGTPTDEFRVNGLSQYFYDLPATVPNSIFLYIKQGYYDAIGSYDFHLKSRVGRFGSSSWGTGAWVADTANSPAIDAGDPAADYAREPAGANGGRLNLGAYGNTPQASKTDPYAPAIASVVADTVSDYTQPHFAVTLGGSGSYLADVYCCLGASDGGAGTNGWEIVALNATGAVVGDVVDAHPHAYFAPGETYWYKIAMFCNGALVDETQSAQVTIPQDASAPPWAGHGGDASKVIHFRPAATGRGDGSNWADACTTLDAALALATAARNEIWMAGAAGPELGVALSPSFPMALRGGFAGTEDDASERADGLRFDIDGGQGRPTILKLANDGGARVTVERIRFHHAAASAVDKSGTGDLVILDCDFTSNCWQTATASPAIYGFGLNATGGSTATLAVSNCTFTCNTSHRNATSGAAVTRGAAAYLEALRAATFDNCLFAGNGVENSGADRENCLGTVLFATGAPIVCTGSKFLGGLATSHGASSGSVIYLTGSGGGSAFRNCSFVGNGATRYSTTSPTSGYGLFTVNFAGNGDAIMFDNCTFAYNFTANDRHSAGLEIVKGAATVRNSIFYGNANRGAGETAGKDILVSGNETTSTLDIDFSMLTADNGASLSATYPAALTVGGHMRYGDPAFVSTPDDFIAALNGAAGFTNSVNTTSFKSRDAAAALNVHLRGGAYAYTDETTGETCVVPMPAGSALERSPAIDMGDPASSVAGEPSPNGGVINLGAYGGTAFATRSPVGRVAIVSAVVDQSSDGTQPHVAVTLGGEGAYAAKVVTCMGGYNGGSTLASIASWEYVKTNATGAANGDVVDGHPGNYFANGAALHWRVFAIDAFGGFATEGGTLTVTGTPLPFQGHGGGAGIVHVRPGAKGRGDGTSWQDAAPTVADGEALLTAARGELWIAAQTFTPADIAMSHTYTVPVTLRGGFTGTEDSAAERAKGAMTKVDGAYDSSRNFCLEVANGAGAPVMIDGFHFDRGYWRAFNKTGDGDIAFRNCRMSRSAPTRACSGTADARVMYFDGASTAAVSFENCVFDENIGTVESNFSVGITGLCLANLRSLQIESCLFVSNGTPFGSGIGREGLAASCLYVSGTPTTVANTRFIANHAINHGTKTGPHIYIGGAGSNGSLFRNCLFGANAATRSTFSSAGNGNGGQAVFVDLSGAANKVAFENCTFAYNYNQVYRAAGLYVNSGTATVTNCVFHANVIPSGTTTAPADIFVSSSGACAMDYTLLGGTGATNVSAKAPPADTSHLVLGDPLFITPTADFLAAMNTDSHPVAGVDKPAFASAAARGVAAGFNYHLSGPLYVDEKTGQEVRTKLKVLSPGVDAGDPSSSYANEPVPNGRRINLGFYGNTPWATCRRSHDGTILVLQ